MKTQYARSRAALFGGAAYLILFSVGAAAQPATDTKTGSAAPDGTVFPSKTPGGDLSHSTKDPAATSAGLQDIVVTANRRAENSQSVPISITALSPKRLEQQNISQPQDLMASVPSLVVGANGQGSRDSQTYTLRGQGATFQASPGVVVYMNEVPLPAPITLSQQGGPGNYLDLENLQVLAGPQGTLFGRNTTGGAILLVPHKPTNDLAGSFKAQYGNYNDNEFEGMLNIPVIDDKLLVRIVGAYHDRDGYTKDLTYNRRLDNTHWYAGRIGVTYRPTERFENYLLAYGAYSKFNGTGLVLEGFNQPLLASYGICTPGTGTGSFSNPSSCDYYQALQDQAKDDGPRKVRPSVRQGQLTKTWGIEDTAKYALTDELALRNIVSYQRFKSFYYYDQDGTTVQQYDSSIPLTDRPRDYLESITEELQLQGTFLDKHLTFTAGGFYYDQKPAGEQGVNSITYCPAAYTGYCTASNASVAVTNKSKALYAQGTLDFGALASSLEGLRFTGGFRYTWDTIKGNAYSYSTQSDGSYLCSSSGEVFTRNPAENCSFSATLHSKAPTWTIGLDYRASKSLLVYGKISRGYKAGGFNSYSVRAGTETFDPEYVTAYEAGFKSDFRIMNFPARLNANYYFLNYSNIQKATGDFNTVTQASGARIYAAKAHVQGIELEATIRPWKPLEIGGNFSYTHFKYTQYLIENNGLKDCSGAVSTGEYSNLKCLPGQYVAPYIWSIHAAVNQPVGHDKGNIALFVNYAHTSAQHTEAVILDQPYEKLAGYGLLSASLDWNNVNGSKFDAGVFVTNATNKLYRISNSDVFQSLAVASTIYGEPRMYGLRVRYHFGD